MRAAPAGTWWAVRLRGAVAILFGLAIILMLPSSTTASFVILFAAYLAADGFFALLAATRGPRPTERSWSLILEGLTNLGVASSVLAWPAIAVVPFLHVLSIWAVVTGALMLAAARRMSPFHGRWALVLAGAISTGWGVLLATMEPDATNEPGAMAVWLMGYAVLFGVSLFILSLYQRKNRSDPRVQLSSYGSVVGSPAKQGRHRPDFRQ